MSSYTRDELNYVLSVLEPNCLNVFASLWCSEFYFPEVVIIRGGAPKTAMVNTEQCGHIDRRLALRDGLRMAEEYLKHHAPFLVPVRCPN